MSKVNTYIGSPVDRVEDLRLLRGRGIFVDDIHCEGQLFGCVLRSSIGHGILKAVVTTAALQLPGVHAVLTARDLASPTPKIPVRLFPIPELQPFEQPVLAESKVRYVGEPIAFVIAESAGIAEDALDLIEVDIEPLPAVADKTTSRRDERLLFDEAGTNRAVTYEARKGDAEAAFATADYTRREWFDVHRHTGVPMEPRGLVAQWDEEKQHMTVWGAAKAPFAARRILAKLMALPEAAIDMLEFDVGGSFGIRGEFYPEDFLVPFAARHMGRPVKWTEDRREHLLTANHARDAEIELEIACRKDGTILGLRGLAHADVGAYLRTAGNIGPRNLGQFLVGPYRMPNVHIDVAVQLSNKTPSATYRGPGRYEADFFRERLFDLVAADLGIDRVEFRRMNLVSEEEMPYPLPSMGPAPNPTNLDSGVYEETLNRCLQESGWAEKQALQGKLIDGVYHGLAVGCFIEGGAAGPSENARIVLEEDGSASVYVGSALVGQGLETVLSQIAADALEIPMARIKLLHGSTTYVADGWGSYHSRSVVMGGSAILQAATELRDLIRAAAAKRLGCAADEVRLSGEVATGPDGTSLSFADVASDKLTVEAKFSNTRHTYSYGTHVAHLTVDPGIGRIDLLSYTTVEDAGRIINPKTLHGQAIGAIVQGLGGTILENLVYDGEGQLLAASFADYLMPLATDFPNLRSISLELRPSPFNPLGAKGAGEGGIIPVGGVIANAVANALQHFGADPRSLPLSPPKIWEMIAGKPNG